MRALTLCPLISASCSLRSRDFRVVPAAPNYILRSPDSRQIPFPELLRAYNGFEQGSASVELRPDMELRIENAYFEPGSSRQGLAGFLGTEIAQYKVSLREGLSLVLLRPMKGRPSDQRPVQELIPPSQQGRRYFIYYHEVLFRKSGNARGSVLLSAQGQEELKLFAADLMGDPDTVCSEGAARLGCLFCLAIT